MTIALKFTDGRDDMSSARKRYGGSIAAALLLAAGRWVHADELPNMGGVIGVSYEQPAPAMLPATSLPPTSSPPASLPPTSQPSSRPLAQPPELPSLPQPLTAVPQPAIQPISAVGLFTTPFDAPLGFTGPSSVLPRETQTEPQFIPVEDRWRIGFPSWDRYGKGHPTTDDYPFIPGNWWDPFNQNVLKGDFPIMGQNVFLAFTASSRSIADYHEVPIATTPFESTARPNTEPFFGRPDQFQLNQFFALSMDLFRGDAAFRQPDWRVKVTPIFNINYLAGEELAEVSPNIQSGTDRARSFMALEEYFVETKIADLSPNFDFVSLRAGSQFFNSDFRGFIFSDTNLGARLFGDMNSNREQFNAVYFDRLEKDTNSGLNTFTARNQQVAIANYYVQDFIWPGYTAQASFHYNHDDPSFHFDKNGFLARPDPDGVFQPHGLDVCYVGWTGDGHINRFNIDHAFYWAFGRDSDNPIANRGQDISAQMAALELSYDRDWVRFRISGFYASGDSNPNNGHATGFDSIFDDPNFAGGQFSYWQRQQVRLLGVSLTSGGSLLADLRSSKLQGQSNFVNPGLQLLNYGMDFEITPKLRLITNANVIWFDETAVLQTFTFQNNIHRFIGTDLSAGFEYRPLLSNNVIMNIGVASLIPGQGFNDLYANIPGDRNILMAAFVDMVLQF
jgi:hypothetical protein